MSVIKQNNTSQLETVVVGQDLKEITNIESTDEYTKTLAIVALGL
jgi:hypothetical protein